MEKLNYSSLIIAAILLISGCGKTEHYSPKAFVGEVINPGFKTQRMELVELTELFEANAKKTRLNAESADSLIEKEAQLNACSSYEAEVLEIKSVYAEGDEVWRYDNHLWNQLRGEDGIVILRNGIIIYVSKNKMQ